MALVHFSIVQWLAFGMYRESELIVVAGYLEFYVSLLPLIDSDFQSVAQDALQQFFIDFDVHIVGEFGVDVDFLNLLRVVIDEFENEGL